MTTERPRRGIHHVAYACCDIQANHHFYADLLGLELVHTEVTPFADGFFHHVFYDTGDGTCLAFFDLHGVGEEDKQNTAVSTGLGMPAWVNHFALRSDPERTKEILNCLEAAGHDVLKIDHGWCRSRYVTDPNGIAVELCEDTPGFDPDPEAAKKLLDVVPDGTRVIS